MQPGMLVTPAIGAKHMYRDICDDHRIFVGTFDMGSLGICIDSDYSSTDVYYVKVFVAGVVGWVRPEGLRCIQ